MCPTKQSLINIYNLAARTYADEVTKMHGAAAPSLEDFKVFFDIASAAHNRCQDAHDRLKSHIEEHGC
jgi:hypothetical protein